ncbi:unnamed protein product [Vitrella brassicaformis CCMP3155]|uniref:Uncharacterized protein n=1 Tax=Vitrella brassicaformis (strain CCMP3155) TaxID=1169540 RepID=A0A0G4FX05_VITBC|nr:unnamed protein product [Vitrella brassicaformis CCMP3155]|eukprot:CEM19481.1 unnamed protein product [Vitrella brassicaformis CCMP3155]
MERRDNAAAAAAAADNANANAARHHARGERRVELRRRTEMCRELPEADVEAMDEMVEEDAEALEEIEKDDTNTLATSCAYGATVANVVNKSTQKLFDDEAAKRHHAFLYELLAKYRCANGDGVDFVAVSKAIGGDCVPRFVPCRLDSMLAALEVEKKPKKKPNPRRKDRVAAARTLEAAENRAGDATTETYNKAMGMLSVLKKLHQEMEGGVPMWLFVIDPRPEIGFDSSVHNLFLQGMLLKRGWARHVVKDGRPYIEPMDDGDNPNGPQGAHQGVSHQNIIGGFTERRWQQLCASLGLTDNDPPLFNYDAYQQEEHPDAEPQQPEADMDMDMGEEEAPSDHRSSDSAGSRRSRKRRKKGGQSAGDGTARGRGRRGVKKERDGVVKMEEEEEDE